MVRFVQTYEQRAPGLGVFDAGWLVDNSTYANKNTPRHMPCLQPEFDESGAKNYVEYFSDLVFEQPPGHEAYPVSLPVMTFLVFEKNNEPMASILSEGWTESVTGFDKASAQINIPYVVEFGQVVTKPKSPKKVPPTENSDKTVATTETTNQTVAKKQAPAKKTSPTTTSAGPPSARKKRKVEKRVAKQEVTEEEEPWVQFVASKRWMDRDLQPPSTNWQEVKSKDNNVTLLRFLQRIITFNRRMELAQWLTSKSIERVIILGNETEQNLVEIKNSLLKWKSKWDTDIDIEEIHTQYQDELTRIQEEAKREEERAKKEKEEEERNIRDLREKAKQKEEDIMAKARQEIEEVKRKSKLNNPLVFYFSIHVHH